MDNATVSDVSWTPNETAEYFQRQINLPVLKDMLTTFFQAKASEKGDDLMRRPPVAIRLLDGGDHVYTIRPGWKSPSVRYREKQTSDRKLPLSAATFGERFEKIQQFGRFQFDKLYVDAIHQNHGKCATFNFDDTKLSLTSWYHTRYFEALENFAQTSKEFVLFPWQVLSRSKDHCCICGKNLTDEISRGRGIGPDCLRVVSNCFGQPVK